jgi:hypothetical protein
MLHGSTAATLSRELWTSNSLLADALVCNRMRRDTSGDKCAKNRAGKDSPVPPGTRRDPFRRVRALRV